jgi:hypothetical protein
VGASETAYHVLIVRHGGHIRPDVVPTVIYARVRECEKCLRWIVGMGKWVRYEMTYELNQLASADGHMLRVFAGDTKLNVIKEVQVFQKGALLWEDLAQGLSLHAVVPKGYEMMA